MGTIKSKGKRLAVLAAAFAVIGVDGLSAGDLAAGKRKAVACLACHDQRGLGTAPHFPHLAGQQEFYLIKQLESFRAGERGDEMMTIVTKSLSDDDIADLAAWYASLPRKGE